MKAYIINLKEAANRRQYMQKQIPLLSSSLSFEFVEAIDGRTMNVDDLNKQFDSLRFRSRYNREVRSSEIGCTLSHQRCYHKLIESGGKSVLILEDDIVVLEDISLLLSQIEELVDTDQPRVVLLSGWYWYLVTKKMKGKYRLASVYDALLAHAYVINRAAALLLIEQRPYIVADDWFYIRKKGVKLDALLPHVLNQDWSGQFSTSINIEKKKIYHVSWRRKIMRSFPYLIRKLLSSIKHFEKW